MFRGLLFFSAAAWLAGCDQRGIEVYRVPKELAAPHAHGAAASGGASAQSALKWQLPAGWQELPPGQMRVGLFSVAGAQDQKAQVTIIPLPGLAGSDLENVNRWRGQVGLPPLTREELPGQTERVEIAGLSGSLFDLAGTPPNQSEPVRMLAAILRREDTAWFFKMTGPDPLVRTQKPVFQQFLQTLKFEAGPVALPEMTSGQLPPNHPPIGDAALAPALTASAPPAANRPGGEKPAWQVPPSWQEQAPGPMQNAKFLVSHPSAGKAEVTVSVIPGDGGGALANLNRWRGQLGLKPIDADGLANCTRPLPVGNGSAQVVELTTEDAQRGMLAASLARDGSTWFFKLMGPTAAVTQEKEAFLRFVQSLK